MAAGGLKFAIAGTGAMGLEHIRNISLLRDQGSTIIAVADSDERGRAEARAELDTWGFPDCKVVADWHELFDCGCDAFCSSGERLRLGSYGAAERCWRWERPR